MHCGAALGRAKDEEDELAAWSGKETYDEITGAALPPDLVRQARAEEVKFMLDWGVWERAPIADCWHETGKAPIGSKWVDVNKGDASKPLIRSRFVVKAARRRAAFGEAQRHQLRSQERLPAFWRVPCAVQATHEPGAPAGF